MTQVSPESQHLVPTVGASVDLGAHLTFRSESMRSRSIQAYRLKEGRPETVPHRPPSTHLWPLSPAFPGINRTPPLRAPGLEIPCLMPSPSCLILLAWRRGRRKKERHSSLLLHQRQPYSLSQAVLTNHSADVEPESCRGSGSTVGSYYHSR